MVSLNKSGHNKLLIPAIPTKPQKGKVMLSSPLVISHQVLGCVS